MHTQAMAGLARSSMFTCLYGFMRIAVAENDWLHISDNLTKGTGENDAQRRNLDVNLRIVHEMFFFVFGSVVRAYKPGVILPPSFRQRYHSPTYTEATPVASPLSLPQHLTQLIGVSVWGVKAWVWKIMLQVCGASLLTCAGNFSVPSLSGTFKRRTQR
jgi:hypothetical protein